MLCWYEYSQEKYIRIGMENEPYELIDTVLSNRYRILTEVGKGRIGVVYKATDLRLDRTVAIKLLYQDVTGNETGYARFEREARSTGCLSHPNIVTVFDFGLSDNNPFIIMEFLEGHDLQTAITRDGGRLGLERTVEIISQACSALGHAHNRGVVHRDMKPSNIMLIDVEGSPDFVKIVDFGIAKRFDMDEENYERLTMEGQVIGTPAYMSPEQCQARKLDARSDVYSLGCVLFKCLTGYAPFPGTGLIEVMQAHIASPPTRFEDVPNAQPIPTEIKHIVYKALSKLPEQRQQSMSELRFQLNNALALTMGRPGAVSNKTTMVMQKTVLESGDIPAATQVTGEDIGHNELVESAAAGDARAQYLLSVKWEGSDNLQFKQDSVRYLRSSAESGYPEAQFKLARQLLTGEGGTPPSPAAAMSWLQRAAEQNYEPAIFQMANCFESGQGQPLDLIQAVKWYRRSASLGNRQAEVQITGCFRLCLQNGVSGHLPDGFLEWLAARAGEGDANALYSLAMYWRAHGGTHAAAADVNVYLSQAAHLGHPAAQLEVARTLVESRNTSSQDFLEAFSWIMQAAQKGNQEANTLLACCFKNGTGTAPDANQAVQLLQKAAEANVPDAQVLLGTAMLIGDGMPRNITRGISLLKSTADLGNSCAQWRLALCYKNGIGVMRDTREAEKWLIKAAEGRFSQGLPWMSPVPGLKFEEAVQTFQALANLDHKHAYYWLAICLEDGIGIRQDLPKALELYNRAGQKGLEHAAAAAQRLRGQMSAGVTR